jgi:hypothetical protein
VVAGSVLRHRNQLPEMKNDIASPGYRIGLGHSKIDEADRVDVASFDSFPASDAPAWITSGIGSGHAHPGDATRAPPNGGVRNI